MQTWLTDLLSTLHFLHHHFYKCAVDFNIILVLWEILFLNFSELPELNYFTTDQLVILRRELGAFADLDQVHCLIHVRVF